MWAVRTRSRRPARSSAKATSPPRPRKSFRNLEAALADAGARLEHVIKWNIYVVEGQPLQPAVEVFQSVWRRRPNPPLITMAFVSGLAQPDFLVELEAVAVIEESP